MNTPKDHCMTLQPPRVFIFKANLGPPTTGSIRHPDRELFLMLLYLDVHSEPPADPPVSQSRRRTSPDAGRRTPVGALGVLHVDDAVQGVVVDLADHLTLEDLKGVPPGSARWRFKPTTTEEGQGEDGRPR